MDSALSELVALLKTIVAGVEEVAVNQLAEELLKDGYIKDNLMTARRESLKELGIAGPIMDQILEWKEKLQQAENGKLNDFRVVRLLFPEKSLLLKS